MYGALIESCICPEYMLHHKSSRRGFPKFTIDSYPDRGVMKDCDSSCRLVLYFFVMRGVSLLEANREKEVDGVEASCRSRQGSADYFWSGGCLWRSI